MESNDLKPNQLQEVWRNFIGGDFNSLGIFFEAYYEELFYYGMKIIALPDLVKDTIQDLFTDVWARRDKMATVENFKAYLIVSLRRELIRRIVRLRKESSADQFDSLQFSFSAEDFLILSEENSINSKLLARSMDGLTERQREVILLRFFHGLEFSEIGHVLEMNIQSVRNLLFRSLDKIRKDMSLLGVTGADNVEMFLWFIFSKKNNQKLLPGGR